MPLSQKQSQQATSSCLQVRYLVQVEVAKNLRDSVAFQTWYIRSQRKTKGI